MNKTQGWGWVFIQLPIPCAQHKAWSFADAQQMCSCFGVETTLPINLPVEEDKVFCEQYMYATIFMLALKNKASFLRSTVRPQISLKIHKTNYKKTYQCNDSIFLKPKGVRKQSSCLVESFLQRRLLNDKQWEHTGISICLITKASSLRCNIKSASSGEWQKATFSPCPSDSPIFLCVTIAGVNKTLRSCGKMRTAATRPNLELASHTAAKAVRWAEQSEASAGCPPPRHHEHSCKQVLEVEPGLAQSSTPPPAGQPWPQENWSRPAPPPLPPGQLWEDGKEPPAHPQHCPTALRASMTPTSTLLKPALRKGSQTHSHWGGQIDNSLSNFFS